MKMRNNIPKMKTGGWFRESQRHGLAAKGISTTTTKSEAMSKVPVQRDFGAERKQLISEYDKKAIDFLKKTGTKFNTRYFKRDKYFPDDKEERDIYKVTLKNDKGSYTFTFGQSIADSYPNERKMPTEYGVLASVTKYEPGTFENFKGDYGYEEDDLRMAYGRPVSNARKVYAAVVKEYDSMKRLFTQEELEEMSEIQ